MTGIPTRCPTCGSTVVAFPDGHYESPSVQLLDLVGAAEKRAERYRATLVRIAGEESGVWGRWAHEALTEAEA